MTNGIWPNDGSNIHKEDLTTLRASVARLVEKWREERSNTWDKAGKAHPSFARTLYLKCDTLDSCTDELEAAFRAEKQGEGK